MRGWRGGSTLAALVLALVFLTGCGLTDDEPPPPPTATPIPPPATASAAATAAASGPAIPAGGTPAAALDAGNGRVVSDGVCRVTVPSGWVDDGTGSGRTAGGHIFTLFGGRLTDAAAWDRAASLFRDQAASRRDATLTEGGGFLHVVYADGRGFAHRTRFADRYCDIRVLGRGSGPIAPQEQATWEAIVASLAPAG